MKESFEQGFEITVNLEGNYSCDPRDPGGETKFGVCKRYHPNLDIENLTLGQAKEIYYKEYWVPAGCDAQPFPMDICLFDSQVNPQNDPLWPGGGNQEIMNFHPENWQEYMLLRMVRYMRNSKPEYVKGHIFRVLRMYQKIKKIV